MMQQFYSMKIMVFADVREEHQPNLDTKPLLSVGKDSSVYFTSNSA